MLAALGPNMLALARDRACGAYPFLVTPSYVTDARAVLGDDKTLAVLLMVVPTTDREAARRAAATPLDFLTKVGGYRRNLLRQGFSEPDIDDVSDRLLDGITAWASSTRSRRASRSTAPRVPIKWCCASSAPTTSRCGRSGWPERLPVSAARAIASRASHAAATPTPDPSTNHRHTGSLRHPHTVGASPPTATRLSPTASSG